MYRYLIVWYNPAKNLYTFKILKHNYNGYYVGFINDYNLVVVIFSDISNYLYVSKYYFGFKRRFKRKLISFLERL